MARENVDVITIICNNASYAILQAEFANARLGTPGQATRAMTQLNKPAIDWVSLGKSLGISASARATTVEDFERLLTAALSRHGPSLIDAVLRQPAASDPDHHDSVSFA